MTSVAEALRLGHGLMNEMALTNGETIPGIDLDRQHPDQCLDQPGPKRDPGGSTHSPPAAEAGHSLVHADGLLPHHNPTQQYCQDFPLLCPSFCPFCSSSDFAISMHFYPNPTSQANPTYFQKIPIQFNHYNAQFLLSVIVCHKKICSFCFSQTLSIGFVRIF